MKVNLMLNPEDYKNKKAVGPVKIKPSEQSKKIIEAQKDFILDYLQHIFSENLSEVLTLDIDNSFNAGKLVEGLADYNENVAGVYVKVNDRVTNLIANITIIDGKVNDEPGRLFFTNMIPYFEWPDTDFETQNYSGFALSNLSIAQELDFGTYQNEFETDLILNTPSDSPLQLVANFGSLAKEALSEVFGKDYIQKHVSLDSSEFVGGIDNDDCRSLRVLFNNSDTLLNVFFQSDAGPLNSLKKEDAKKVSVFFLTRDGNFVAPFGFIKQRFQALEH